jgi:hypothetical protein
MINELDWYAFHAEGERRFPHGAWQIYCTTLVDRGADRVTARLILDQPNRHELVRYLFYYPQALERALKLKTTQARRNALRQAMASVGP